jgi:hypothetical protein
MDEQPKQSFKIPMEWIDRIFKRFDEIWGVRFLNQFNSDIDFDLERTRWQSGLYGLSPEEIKKGVDMARLGQIPQPPNVMEFFHYCRGNKPAVPPKPKPATTPNRELGEKYIKLLRDKLHGRLNSEGVATLSALDQQVLGNQKHKEPTHWQDN